MSAIVKHQSQWLSDAATDSDRLESAFEQIHGLKGWRKLHALYKCARYFGLPAAATRQMYELWIDEQQAQMDSVEESKEGGV